MMSTHAIIGKLHKSITECSDTLNESLQSLHLSEASKAPAKDQANDEKQAAKAVASAKASKAPTKDQANDEKQIDRAAAPTIVSSVQTGQAIAVSTIIPFKQITFAEQIGQGTFATVYKGLCSSMTVAIKKLNYSKTTPTRLLDAFRNECNLMEKIKGLSSVVKYIGYAEDRNAHSYNMVMEYLPKGDVCDWIHSYWDRNEHAPWGSCYRILENTAAAIAEIHNARIVHCDLKWGNVLYVDKDQIKLADFGFAIELQDKEESKKTDRVHGTVGFFAPEILNKAEYSHASDIFAFGAMIYEIAQHESVLRYPGWTDAHINAYVAAGNRQSISKQCPAKLASLINHCWMQDPKQRPTAQKLREELHALTENYQRTGCHK